MNIFVFSNDTRECARQHCKKHLTKMILEYAQLLCTTHHMFGTATPEMYKKTHQNHPCAVWVRESHANYQWLYQLFLDCLIEFKDRRGKSHKSEELIKFLCVSPWDKLGLERMPMTPFAQAMPDQYKNESPTLAYQQYFRSAKRELADWENVTPPKWYV